MAKRIRTINTESLQKTAKTGGCGECQTSCQSKIIKREPTALFFYVCNIHILFMVYIYEDF